MIFRSSLCGSLTSRPRADDCRWVLGYISTFPDPLLDCQFQPVIQLHLWNNLISELRGLQSAATVFENEAETKIWGAFVEQIRRERCQTNCTVLLHCASINMPEFLTVYLLFLLCLAPSSTSRTLVCYTLLHLRACSYFSCDVKKIRIKNSRVRIT